MDNLTRIQHALSSLMVRPNDDAFVIVEHEPTGKFVQFAGSAAELLLLDLPSQTLSELEFYRAVEFFRRMGVTGEENSLLDEPYGHVVGTQFSFNANFRSAEDAARTAMMIFKEVYGYPEDCGLLITEN